MSDEFRYAISNYLNALHKLKDLNIITNKRDFTSQIGEWLVEEIYQGQRAKSANQKDWDVLVKGEKIQVKAHAKAKTTKARFTAISYDDGAQIDKLIIIVFSPEYELLEFFVVPWNKAYNLISEEKHRNVIYWNKLQDFKVNIEQLPKQDIVNIFRSKLNL